MRHTQIFVVKNTNFLLGMFKMVEAISKWKEEHPKATYISDERKELASFDQDTQKNLYMFTVKYIYEEETDGQKTTK
jgi:hypothetical protein